MPQETEVKLAVDDVAALVDRLEALGARLVTPRHFEDNRLYDLPGGELVASGRLLRLREAAGRAILTAKGAPDAEAMARGYKSRPEVEVDVDDAGRLVGIFGILGLVPLWRYQKWRREYALDGAAVVIDETPHGPWMEIEADATRIDEVAARLGYGPESYRAVSYRTLHVERCRELGVEPGDMVFGTSPEDPA